MARYSNPRRRTLGRTLIGRRRKLLPSQIGPAPVVRGSIFGLIGKILIGIVALVVLLAIGGAASAYAGYSSLAASLKPRLESISSRNDFETSRIYDRNGTLLYEFVGSGKRTHVDLKDISPLLREATISIEDKTFYENAGFDPRGILYAMYVNLTSGAIAGGGSSITQQLVKGVVLTEDEVTTGNQYWRKVKEVILAQELTQQYSKDQILELYLNEIYYGNLSYGIEAAAQSYFGVSAKDLSLPQAALLAGLPQLPSAYDPVTNGYLDGDILPGVELGPGWYQNDYPLPEGLTAPKRRQIAVMSQLVDEGYVKEADGRAALAQDLKFAPQEQPLNAPHFVFWIRRQLEEKYGQQFANEGLSIYTTLDLNLQNLVQEKARERIGELEQRNIHNAAVVVMQPNTGQVLAMVGSIDYNSTKASSTPGQPGNVLDGQVNVAIRERQPGSALKPFTYLSALEQGATPATVWWDVPTEFNGGAGDDYAPLNYNGRFNGPLRMRTALANSLNLPAVKALKFAGIQNTIDLLHRAGISGLQRGQDFYGLSLTLGGGEVTPLDLTTAYNTLASGGRYYPPVGVLQIVKSDGTVLEQYTQPAALANVNEFDATKVQVPATAGEQVLNPDHVAIITNMMADNAARAPVFTLNSRLKLSRPAAVKTGTTNDWRDAWAAGFTPYVTVGVWTGNNNNEPTEKVESVTSGGAIWNSVMEAIFADPRFQSELAAPYNGTLPLEFTLPSDITRKSICKLPGPYNYFGEELFSPDMLKTGSSATATAGNDSASQSDGCNLTTEITVAQLGTTQVSNDNGETISKAQYCQVPAGTLVPEDRLTKTSIWKTPKADPDEKTQYTWQGTDTEVMSAGSVPECTTEQIAAMSPPPGTVRMPDLRGFGENQAKEQLLALGFNPNNIFVQYQERYQIPDIFDQFPAYAVVSSIPSSGTYVAPDEFVFLGIRAPEGVPTAVPADGTQPLPPTDGTQPLPPADGTQPQPTALPVDDHPQPTAPPADGGQPPAPTPEPGPPVPTAPPQ